jgi:hypothetical protein
VHSVAPTSGTVGKAIAQFISRTAWNSFVLAYEKSDGSD